MHRNWIPLLAGGDRKTLCIVKADHGLNTFPNAGTCNLTAFAIHEFLHSSVERRPTPFWELEVHLPSGTHDFFLVCSTLVA